MELSEEAAVTAVVLANFEFHSSGVREFELWVGLLSDWLRGPCWLSSTGVFLPYALLGCTHSRVSDWLRGPYWLSSIEPCFDDFAK